MNAFWLTCGAALFGGGVIVLLVYALCRAAGTATPADAPQSVGDDAGWLLDPESEPEPTVRIGDRVVWNGALHGTVESVYGRAGRTLWYGVRLDHGGFMYVPPVDLEPEVLPELDPLDLEEFAADWELYSTQHRMPGERAS